MFEGILVNKSRLGLLLFFTAWLVFYLSPAHYVTDSAYSMLMDEAIVHHGSPNMIAYQVPQGSGPGFYRGYPWQLAMIKGRLLYTFPWGSPLLSLPAVAILEAVGFEVAPKHIYNVAEEIKMQAMLSAFLCAITVLLLYQTARLFLPPGWSLAIGLGAAFGTQIWSSLSRSLWPQTWYVLLITGVVLLLASHRIRPIALATLLGWACLTRPAALPGVIIVSAYILIECESNRSRLIFFGAGLLWAAAFALMLLVFTGHLLAPVYHAEWFAFQHGVVQRIEGILFSPSRGLLIYSPVVLFPLYLAVRYWRELPERRLVVLAIVVCASTIMTHLSWPIWWGGWSYGPRALAAVVPWLVVLTILGLRAFLDDPRMTARKYRIMISTAMALLLVSVAMNAPGALSSSAMDWNALRHIDEHAERLWDWQHPPFLAWIQSAPSP